VNTLDALKKISFVIGMMKQREAIAASERQPDTIDATPSKSTPDGSPAPATRRAERIGRQAPG
jgi:hypothetical protein